MLVATNVTPRRITDVRIEPKIPANTAESVAGHEARASLSEKAEINSVKIRKATATPKTTHKNAGVTVITAVMRNIAAITPIIRLPMKASPVQVTLFLQLKSDIYFTSHFNICEG